MKLTKKTETQVLKVYDIWLDSYLNGNVETYDKYLDKDYHFIGSTENEEFLTRKATTKFFAATAEQLAGKCELRNETRTLEQFGELVFITHLFDAWFLNGEDLSYYGRFRFTSVLQKNKEGWLFIYQHFSTTDSKAQEGETIGFDQISAENLQLREAVKRRTVELEQKSRELEIETALEKVRARSLAMQSSDELVEASDVMFLELEKLAINTLRIGICTINGKNGSAEIWSRSENKNQKETKILGVVPKGTHPVFDNMIKAWKEKNSFFTSTRKGKAVEVYYKKLAPHLSYPLPNSYNKEETISTFFFKEGSLNVVSLQPLINNECDIMLRFSKVFGQIYQRFLDLQKAEAQTRTAQISLAVERVRAKALAMHKSEEIMNVVAKLKDEVMSLDIPDVVAATIFLNEGHDKVRMWDLSTLEKDDNGYEIPFDITFKLKKIDPHLYVKRVWENTEDYFVDIQQGKDFKRIVAWLRENDQIKVADDVEKFTESTKLKQLYHAVKKLDNGKLVIDLMNQPSEEMETILIKMGAAFDLAYKRFEDLQKAEAQTKEALIETALEKVRSRSLAMHKPDELQEVVTVVAEKLQELGVILDAGGVIICTYFPDNKDVMHWISAPDFSYSGSYFIPYFNDSTFNEAWDSKNSGDSYFSKAYPQEEKNKFFEYAFEHTDYRNFPDEFKQLILQSTEYALSFAWQKNSAILIPSHSGIIPSESDAEIMIRFAKVFEQAYIRFMDLQKAEEHAHEAKIEASLEKVRTVAITLKKSDDMLDIAQVLYEQLLVLGFNNMRNAIIDIHNDDETFLDYDYSHDMSSAVTLFSFYGDPVIEQQVKKIESSNDAFFEIDIKGKELERLIETRLRNGEKDDPRLHKIDHLTYNLYSFGNGAIGISNFGTLSDDHKKILKRFRNVFTFAYKRYTDLARAEAQALEAKIEAALEKVRSVALSLKTSEDMLEVAQVLYEQLLTLGFTNIRNSIIDIDNEDDTTFLDYDYSHEMGGTVTLMSYKDDPTLKVQLEDIIATTDGFSEMVLEGKQLQDLIEMRRKNGEADDPRLINTDSLSYILYAFGKGAIGISNFGILNESQKTILSRFRNVFTFAYQRYTDLAQSEAQAAALLAEKQRLEVTLSDLQATQKQLIQSEKMASLGELTAGIAHEIQNPLNFVNNFSEVSQELIDELIEELENGNIQEVKDILNDVIQNLEKINHHGRRADGIVKGMLQHSRSSKSQKEPADINALCDEYLRLAYHGLRAKDKTFNAKMETDFDESIGKINIVPQDIGRVILNLITNAFYTCNEKKNESEDEKYEPLVTVITKKLKNEIAMSVKDNGNGIPKHVLDKIFQPFFTTKPTGQGTGLGLSMSYDIIHAHGGELKVETKEGEGTSFIINLKL